MANDSNRFPLHNAIKKILDDPNSRPELPGLKPEPKPTFPREWIGVFPDKWSESVQVFSSQSLQDEGTEKLNDNLQIKSLQDEGTENPNKDLGIRISGSPAVAVFNNKLYCVYEGPENEGVLHYCTFNGQKWSVETTLLDHKMSGSPALAVFQDKLYCVYEGKKESGWLHYCTFNGQKWSDDTALDYGTSLRARRYPCASLAVYKDKLYCVHEGAGNGGKGWLYYFTFDGQIWSDDKPLGNHGTTGGGSLVVIDGKLICMHEGKDGSGWMWYTTFDDAVGTNEWYEDRQLVLFDDEKKEVKCTTSGPPATVTYGNKLFCVHEGSGNDGWLWSFNNDTKVDHKIKTDRPDTKDTEIGTSFPPGLALYKNSFWLLHQERGGTGWLKAHSAPANEVLPDIRDFNLLLPDPRPDRPYRDLDRYNLPLTEHQTYRDDAHPVEMTRHHIIPDNRLRDFWNRMVETDHIYTAAGEFLAALDENMDRYRITLRQADIEQLRELLRGIRNGTIRHNPDVVEGRHLIDNLAIVIRWLPGNIFIGPTGGGGRYQRMDDPGNSFEENADTVVGEDFPHREANNELEAYMSNDNANNARQALRLLARIAVRVEPYDVNPSNWMRVFERYRLHRRGDLGEGL